MRQLRVRLDPLYKRALALIAEGGSGFMKIEIGQELPSYFRPAYPEEFELFSHFEVTAGIPTVLFAVTTWKAKRQAQCVLPCMELLPWGQDRLFCG